MLLAAGFAACSDEEETLGGKDIQFAEGTSDKIEVARLRFMRTRRRGRLKGGFRSRQRAHGARR